MNPEILAILNTRSPDLRMLPSGYGALSGIDLSHAIGMVNGYGPQLLGRVHYAQQHEWVPALTDELYIRLSIHAGLSGWKNRKPLFSLSQLSISLYSQPKRCTKCSGIGQRVIADKVYVCQRCNGSTWHAVRPAEMARKVGVSKPAWASTWEARLKVSISILAGWDRVFCAGIARALK